MHRLLRVLSCCLALAAAGCSGDVTTPTEPTDVPESVIETFTGTLTVNGAQSHTFRAGGAGAIEVVLGDVTPDGVIVGLSLGTWNGGICTAVLSGDAAPEGFRIIGATSTAGDLCVRIYDTGQVTEPTAYSIQVDHP